MNIRTAFTGVSQSVRIRNIRNCRIHPILNTTFFSAHLVRLLHANDPVPLAIGIRNNTSEQFAFYTCKRIQQKDHEQQKTTNAQ